MVGGLEYGLESWSSVLESVLEYRKAILGLVLKYSRVVLVLGLDLRLSVLGLDSYSAKAVLVPSLSIYEATNIDSVVQILVSALRKFFSDA